MKKYTVLFASLILVLITLLACCSSSNSSDTTTQVQPEEKQNKQPTDKTSEPATYEPEPFIPDTHKDEDTVNTSNDIEIVEEQTDEVDDVFSKRDLNCSPDLSDAVAVTAFDNGDYTISSAGIYVLSGNAENFTVKVEAGDNDKVQIVLNNAVISNDDFPVIYVKTADKCFVTSMGENTLSVNNKFVSDGDINADAVIFSKSDLTLNGNGTASILSVTGNGITSKDDLKITGGEYNITCALDGIEANDSISISNGEFTINSSKDAMHCENDDQAGSIYIRDGIFNINADDDGIQATTTLVIDGGEFNITASEGMEATYIQINDGAININASDDGINAARKSYEYDVIIEINGGTITVVMGPGDTDGLDANGTIIVNGGTVDVTGQSTFDADLGSIYNGGTIIINGVVVDSIPESMMGGPGGNFGNRPGRF